MTAPSLSSISDADLELDRQDSLEEIRKANKLMRHGVTHRDDGFPIEAEVWAHLKIVRQIEAEQKRRKTTGEHK